MADDMIENSRALLQQLLPFGSYLLQRSAQVRVVTPEAEIGELETRRDRAAD
jgi:hypothetical protein